MRVLIADDQHEVRSALRLLLEQSLSLEVIGEVADGQTLLSSIYLTHPDLLLLDWELPGPATTTLIAALRERHPMMEVVVLSGQPEAEAAALAAGATGFISKGAAPDRLLSVLRAVVARRGKEGRDEAFTCSTGG